MVLQWHCDSVSGSGFQVSHFRTGLRKEAVQLRQTVGWYYFRFSIMSLLRHGKFKFWRQNSVQIPNYSQCHR